MKSFPSLHTHDYFSLLDGVPKPTSYFERCDELEMSHIAFTNHGSMGSLAEATIDSSKFDVNPIMGLEAYLVFNAAKMQGDRGKSFSREEMSERHPVFHTILLAKNEVGFRNLVSLNNFAWKEGFYYKPKIDYSHLFKHSEGLICTSACLSGIISKLILDKKSKLALRVAKKMKEQFGEDFYIELQLIDLKEQDVINKKLIQLGHKLNIPFVLTNDAHYVYKGQHELQMILMEIESKGKFSYSAPENYLKSLKEWEQIRRDRKSIPKDVFNQAIDNCCKIADQCDFTVPLGNLFFPTYDHKTHFMYIKFPIKDKATFFKQMMIYRAKNLLKEKFNQDVYRKRLIYEYNTLVSLGAVDYFLICDDLLNYVRSEGAFSLIRGSANGSLIAYVFGFGLIDPIKHSIMFERFISKYRSLNDVDIDIDVRSEFRPKAINYLRTKYGEDRVISVGTYNRMQLKGAIKDVTRTLKDRLANEIAEAETEGERVKLFNLQKDYQFSVINKITSPMEGELTIDKAREQYKVFDVWYKSNRKVAEEYIAPLVGTVRNVSLHPAGVVLIPENENNLLPIRTQPNPSDKKSRVTSTVWENSHTSREDLNEIGMMILDILGVKTLSVVSEVIDLVLATKGKEIDLYNLDLEDKETFDLFNEGELIGVFQFSGGSASKIVNMVRITEFNDLIVINALARPGALAAGADASFAKRKRNPSLVKYAHHSLENILGDSLGVLTFSEHILRTASDFAGMHPKKADALRKIIKGKNPEVFKSYKKKFIKGAIKKWKGEPGIETIANNIWEKFSQAGSYLFPRGHAASYALLGYLCQYLKVHYPVEFFACHLRYQPQSKYAEVKAIAERHYNIQFNLPLVSTPKLQFEPHGMAIEWPITAIKNIGSKAATTIIENAPYSSIKDFYDRVNKRACNSRIVESLIIAGCFKEFGKKKAVLLEYRALKGKKELEKELPSAFFSKENMIMAMDDLYGFEAMSLKKLYKKKLKLHKNFTSLEKFNKLKEYSRVKIFGKVVKRTAITTAKNTKMAFLNVRNGNEEFKVTLFPDVFELVKDKIKKGDVIVLSGKKNVWNKESSIILSTDRLRNNKNFESGSWVEVL